ncbi:DUF1549 and DUF1553 domain-containing protein [Tundrisphaera lichenicola]|uniref:DUF1549 and DUF1553 domain-containing protein n=1 Tax=Tundrisphaera lichenicola TaxID=2029860 RepID=UPI003EBABA72
MTTPLAHRSFVLAWLWLALSQDPSRAEGLRPMIEPTSIAIEGSGKGQQVAISIESKDGTSRDVTGVASYTVEPRSIAAVTRTGLILPRSEGRGRLIVEVEGQHEEVNIEVGPSVGVPSTSYRLDIVALLSKAGCNAGPCHGNINGKGGFRLSLRGDDPAFDLLSMTRDAFGRRIDVADSSQSLIYRKPVGLDPHEGGRRFTAQSPEAAALLDWVAEGAKDDLATAPTLIQLEVFPDDRVIPGPNLAQQLVVTATFSDGSRRDVTRQSAFDVNDPSLVAVTPEGRVEAGRPVEAVVAVRYLNGRGVSRLAFLPVRPDFAWREVPEENFVDSLVFAKFKAHKIEPSELSTDSVFLRRAFLDALGVLPTPEEARAFLTDLDPLKRPKLVDRLLERPEFADFWALKWADLLRNEEKTMGAKGVWVFQRWLRDQVAQDIPLDVFARSLIASIGSTYRNPPANFHRTNRDPMTAAETVGQVFLGVRLQCARCHNHPFDSWTQDDYFGLAAYFSNVRRKEINNLRSDRLDKHEINGDELIYLEGTPKIVQPRSGETLAPRPPGGPQVELAQKSPALDELANWLTVDNPQFARNMANRIWFHLMGRGLVEPVDDFRDSNPPTNPKLLVKLADELVNNGYRLRPQVALIMKSRTYGLDARPLGSNAEDEINYSHASVRLLPAEVLLDAIGQVLEHPEPFQHAPPSTRAVQMPGARPGGSFLQSFGKPDRLLTCECERSEATTLAQAFQLINGDSIRAMLTDKQNRIGRLIDSGASDSEVLDELSLAALSHEPDATRRSAILEHVARAPDRRKAWEDVTWAILNSKEFLLRH